MKYFKNIVEETVLFLIGGFSYYGIEMLWRGYSHWTMALVGAISFVLIGMLNNVIRWEIKLWQQMIAGSCIITTIEFICGCILNLCLHMGIWDYSNQPCNLFGQICLLYSVLWMFLSLVAIFLDDFIRWKLFKEQKPVYYF